MSDTRSFATNQDFWRRMYLQYDYDDEAYSSAEGVALWNQHNPNGGSQYVYDFTFVSGCGNHPQQITDHRNIMGIITVLYGELCHHSNTCDPTNSEVASVIVEAIWNN